MCITLFCSVKVSVLATHWLCLMYNSAKVGKCQLVNWITYITFAGCYDLSSSQCACKSQLLQTSFSYELLTSYKLFNLPLEFPSDTHKLSVNLAFDSCIFIIKTLRRKHRSAPLWTHIFCILGSQCCHIFEEWFLFALNNRNNLQWIREAIIKNGQTWGKVQTEREVNPTQPNSQPLFNYLTYTLQRKCLIKNNCYRVPKLKGGGRD